MPTDVSPTPVKNPQSRPLSPHVGIYRWKITSILSILHRGTGIVLALGMIAIVLLLLMLSMGPELFLHLQTKLQSPLTLWAAILWSACLYYHLCNGIRHLCWDMGFGFELKHARASAWIAVAVSIAMTGLTWLTGAA